MAKKDTSVKKTTTKTDNKAVSVLANIQKLQLSLYKKEIANLIMARQDAINVERPRRNMLIELYGDTIMDMFLKGIINNRIVRISNKPFMVIDSETGKPDDAAKLLLKKSWFNKWVKFAMESRMYGHSLIYFKEIVNGEVKQVDVVDRRYVVPELKWVLRAVYDNVPMLDYTDPAFSDYFISAGEDTDLGLLLIASIGVILKKHSWQNWDEFEEIFGIPIRTAMTPGNDKKLLDDIENWLKKMGSAAYGVFPEGTTLDIKENKNSDAFGVFNEKRKAINEELLVLILGQTMTVLNGSSKSQSETHQKTSDEIMTDDLTFIEDLVNDELMPRLISFGYQLKPTHRFAWDTTDALPLSEQWKIDQGLLEKFDIDPEYFQEKYNVPVKAKATNTQTDPPTSSEKKKSPTGTKLSLSTLYNSSCGHSHDLPLIRLTADGSNDAFINELANIVYNNSQEFPYETFSTCANKLIEGFNLNFDFTHSPEKSGFQAKVQSNIYPFSAAKCYEQLALLRDKLTDENGNKKTFAAFKQDARNIVGTFNGGYLAAEYNFAVQCGISAQNWQDIEENADVYPNLEYSTIGDSRVRPEHKALDGIVRPINDEFWNKYYPPNGWHCRCDAIQKDEGIVLTDAKVAGLAGKEGVTDKLFENNIGKTAIVFKEDHPYFKRISKTTFTELKAEENYGLKPLDKLLNNAKLPSLKEKFGNKSEAQTYLNDLKNEAGEILIPNYLGQTILVDKEAVSHIMNKNDGQHWETLNNLTDVLKNPNEVYLQKSVNGGYENWIYVKYYNNNALFTITEVKQGKLTVTSHYQWDGTYDTERRHRAGLLIIKPIKK